MNEKTIKRVKMFYLDLGSHPELGAYIHDYPRFMELIGKMTISDVNAMIDVFYEHHIGRTERTLISHGFKRSRNDFSKSLLYADLEKCKPANINW